MTTATQAMVELRAFSRCLRADDPSPELVEGDPMELTEAGRCVTARLLLMVDQAMEGPAGWDFRSTLTLVRSAFASGDGEAVCAAARMLHTMPIEVAA